MTLPSAAEPTVASWAERIRPHLAHTVDGILAAGRELIDAKAALPHGQFGPLLDELGLSPQHAQRFMRVATHPVLSNASPERHLPTSVTVLDELTRIPDEDLADAIERGDIGPSTTRREAADLAGQHRPEPHPAPELPARAAATPSADAAAPTDDEPVFAPGEPEAILDELHEVHGADIPPDALERAVEENLDSKTPWVPNKPDLGGGISHPARFSTELIPLFAQLLRTHLFPGARVLDPFAGTGRIHELHPEFDTVGIELEPEWAALHERTVVGSALDLPLDDGNVDAVVTSCTYGNRLADSHDASDPERRRSYTHDLGRTLTPGNSGTMHWRDGSAGSADYRAFHEAAWAEAVRVLCPGGIFILNIKDHYRGGLLQLVPDWHTWCLGHLGLAYVTSRAVETRSLRQGANAELRSTEEIYVFMKAPAVAGGGP